MVVLEEHDANIEKCFSEEKIILISMFRVGIEVHHKNPARSWWKWPGSTDWTKGLEEKGSWIWAAVTGDVR